MSDEQQFTRYRVIITVTSAVRTPAGSVPAPLKGARARPGGSDASPMLKAGPAGYSESSAFRRTKRDREPWGQGAAENEPAASTRHTRRQADRLFW